ncbi:peptidylprolyl isomerase [Sediminitomix flava]|nr:peptidylprolyl isomerase [Sediminitomix flava]
MRLIKCLFFGLLMGALPFSSFAQSDAVVVDKIVARVDNHIILLSEVENSYQQMLMNGQVRGSESDSKCQILEQLVINKVMLAKAEIDSVEVDAGQIDGQMEQRMRYMVMQYGSEEKLEEVLGTTVTELEEELREEVREQTLVQTMQGQIINGVRITPKQVEEYYNTIPRDSIPFLAGEAIVGQIIIEPTVSDVENEKARQKLDAIKERIEKGEKFEDLAKLYSEDYGSARQGGDLGWHGRGELVPEFEEVALTIEPGEIADPIKSEFGFHLIQLLERRGNRFHSRHILVRPQPNNDDIKRAEAEMDSVRNLLVADSITFEQAAKDFSDDQATRGNGGLFSDQTTGSAWVATDQLDPVIFFTIDTMSIDSYSTPARYRLEDGSQAVRMIYYKDYKKPHSANLKDDYQKLHSATLNNRKGEIFQEWLKSARNDVFIDIDPEYLECDLLKDL